MALALPTANVLTEVKPQSLLDCPIAVPTETHTLARHRNACISNESTSTLSQEESDDDTPLSPITFRRNEEYEQSRLSYMPPPIPRPSSSPSSPNDMQSLPPVSPVIFSQLNLSSPTLSSQPPPAFPSAGTQSLALRLKRPLPPLPKVDTDDSAATETRSRQKRTWMRSSPSSSDDRDNDRVINFSPATSTQSSATSVYTTASPDSAGSSKAVEAFPAADARPRVTPLTIPARSQSVPLSQSPMRPIGQPIINPYISVTPASPLPPHHFPVSTAPSWERKRTTSSTSIVLPSPCDGGEPVHELESNRECKREQSMSRFPRAASPALSLTPSVSSNKSFTHAGKMNLKRIASKTRLFGRRTLSSASEPTWDDEEEGEETVVGHGSVSFDDQLLRPGERARSASPSTLVSNGSVHDKRAMTDPSVRPVRRLEIVEATLTSHGDIWETRELHDVIPLLRQLRAPGKMKL